MPVHSANTTMESYAKHFEIDYRVIDHLFTYRCTTAYEALDAIASIKAASGKDINMDEMMEILIAMKNNKLLTHHNAAYSIRYIDGEV